MYKELTDIINNSISNDSVHILVLTGKGDFFCSGNDFSVDTSQNIKTSNELFK